METLIKELTKMKKYMACREKIIWKEHSGIDMKKSRVLLLLGRYSLKQFVNYLTNQTIHL